MRLLRSLIQRWHSLNDAIRRELLRDSTIILFERASDPAPAIDRVHGR